MISQRMRLKTMGRFGNVGCPLWRGFLKYTPRGVARINGEGTSLFIGRPSIPSLSTRRQRAVRRYGGRCSISIASARLSESLQKWGPAVLSTDDLRNQRDLDTFCLIDN